MVGCYFGISARGRIFLLEESYHGVGLPLGFLVCGEIRM